MKVKIDGRKVIKFLFDREITVAQMARLSGVSVQAVKNAVEGKPLHITSAAKIARAMGIEPTDLINDGNL